jgi:hypothetical protein
VKLPHADRAIIAEDKLRNYLLDPTRLGQPVRLPDDAGVRVQLLFQGVWSYLGGG